MKHKMVERYQTTDGKVFRTCMEADKHQALVNLQKFFDDHGIGAGGSWTSNMIISEISDNLMEFRDAVKGLLP